MPDRTRRSDAGRCRACGVGPISGQRSGPRATVRKLIRPASRRLEQACSPHRATQLPLPWLKSAPSSTLDMLAISTLDMLAISTLDMLAVSRSTCSRWRCWMIPLADPPQRPRPELVQRHRPELLQRHRPELLQPPPPEPLQRPRPGPSATRTARTSTTQSVRHWSTPSVGPWSPSLVRYSSAPSARPGSTPKARPGSTPWARPEVNALGATWGRHPRCDLGQRPPPFAAGEASPTIGDALTAGAPFTTGQGRLVATPDLCNSCATRRLDNKRLDLTRPGPGGP